MCIRDSNIFRKKFQRNKNESALLWSLMCQKIETHKLVISPFFQFESVAGHQQITRSHFRKNRKSDQKQNFIENRDVTKRSRMDHTTPRTHQNGYTSQNINFHILKYIGCTSKSRKKKKLDSKLCHGDLRSAN